MPKLSVCLKVPKIVGQRAIALVAKLELLDKSLSISRDEDNLCIPLVKQPQQNELKTLKKQLKDFQLAISVFTEKKKPVETLIQVLENQLPSKMLASLPKALDIVGDIAIIEIPNELKPHQNLIGEALLKTQKNLKTVLAKAGDVNGVYRIRNYIFIAGEHKTKTVHREFGCQYHVDIAKAYFSPRLSHEHERVASFVKAGETVVDLFAGVGPFSVLIGRKNSDLKVYAIDLNPDAVELLKINVRVNRVENRVFPILADSREIVRTKLKCSASRAIMNLPETAIDFVDVACQAIKPEGGIIHFYAFIRSPDSVENLKNRFSEAVEKNGRKVESFIYAKSIRETAPYESQIALDAKIT